MAPWVMHLRVAAIVDELLRTEFPTEYYVGSVAPDSGRMTGDFEYVPPKDVSHWKREGIPIEERLAVNAGFFKTFVKPEKDPARRAFFMGYYVHILTDTLFVRDVIKPYINAVTREVWRARIGSIRKCWYEIDFRFVAENPGFYPLELLGKVDSFPNTYFDYFAPDDITDRVRYINELYRSSRPDPSVEMITVDVPGADAFVKNAAEEIKAIILSGDS